MAASGACGTRQWIVMQGGQMALGVLGVVGRVMRREVRGKREGIDRSTNSEPMDEINNNEL